MTGLLFIGGLWAAILFAITVALLTDRVRGWDTWLFVMTLLMGAVIAVAIIQLP